MFVHAAINYLRLHTEKLHFSLCVIEYPHNSEVYVHIEEWYIYILLYCLFYVSHCQNKTVIFT
jgi:hypothetical protein